jgi:hypothetical protein
MTTEIALYRFYPVDANGDPQGVTLDTTNYIFTKNGEPMNDNYGGLKQKYKITQKDTSIKPKAQSTSELENLFNGMKIGGKKRHRTKRRRTFRRRANKKRSSKRTRR